MNARRPIAWARFDAVDDAVKSRAMVDDGDGDPFVLAGNPFADRAAHGSGYSQARS